MKGIREKMIRRHPHVFGDVKVESVQDVRDNWQKIKKREREDSQQTQDPFGNIPRSLPALQRAQKITAAASRCGFDWPDANGVLDKLKEELDELEEARTEGDAAKIEEEMGDLFFTLVNLSRFLNVDAEKATDRAVNKFLGRWLYITRKLAARGRSPEDATPAELDLIWNEAREKGL
jgi:MazG family protein